MTRGKAERGETWEMGDRVVPRRRGGARWSARVDAMGRRGREGATRDGGAGDSGG